MLLRTAALFCVLACGKLPPPMGDCSAQHAVGDPSQPVQLLPIALDKFGNLVRVNDGDPILLQKPPQGGYVVFAGAAARNLQACGAQVTAELIDPATGNPLTGLDQRQADFTVAQAGYFWPVSSAADVANIPSCPDALHVGVAGRTAILRVDVLDQSLHGGRVEVTVKPTCPDGDTQCACICGPDPGGC